MGGGGGGGGQWGKGGGGGLDRRSGAGGWEEGGLWSVGEKNDAVNFDPKNFLCKAWRQA